MPVGRRACRSRAEEDAARVGQVGKTSRRYPRRRESECQPENRLMSLIIASGGEIGSCNDFVGRKGSCATTASSLHSSARSCFKHLPIQSIVSTSLIVDRASLGVVLLKSIVS